MTRIAPSFSARSAPTAARGQTAVSAGLGARFVVYEPQPSAAVAVARMPEVTGLQHLLLGRQDAPAETLDDRGRGRARALLAGLAALQLRLLTPDLDGEGGGSATALLADLRAQLKDMPAPLDPGLAQAMAAVSLRVEVELARRGIE